ncbi:MAG: hypothetical protein CM15mP52_1390 [Candidatus Neomarinimicrobiota bacterium]|nr:MAG: hypothetical protein CM15mP52_1390 [Candidatus Neomarinimicrobiota bacterium]
MRLILKRRDGAERSFEITGGRTVPQIVIDEKPIGGYDDLLKLEQEGKL